ncbi:MAG: hypothetical protein Q4A55_07700 [Aerococcus sp.]|nr:hypothetical protein [Aerococcus sp.]
MVTETGTIYTMVNEFNYRDSSRHHEKLLSAKLQKQWKKYIEDGHDSLFSWWTDDEERIQIPVSTVQAIVSARDGEDERPYYRKRK